MITAISAANFVGTLGVNTHIDFANYGYQNLSVVEAAINYLGLKNLRDSPQWTGDAQTWLQVSQATGAKFDAYIPEGSPANMTASLNLMPQLAQEGILNYIEGGNEEDDAYAASQGNTLQITAQFQQQVRATGQQLGLPVINMSFDSGWTAANNWQGDYGTVGDLSAYTNYANAHTYPGVGQGTDWSIQRLNGLAQLAASTRPVITTEIGWDLNAGWTQQQVATNVLQAAMDGMKDGDVKMYYYSLFNDGSGAFGLMNQDGTPTLAGTALHDLTTLLADTGSTASTFTTGTLAYTLAGTTTNDNSLLMEKSDGSYWLSLWNENDAAHNVTVNLGAAATEIKVFNPVNGLSTIQDVTGQASVTLSVGANPELVEVIGAANTPTTTTGLIGILDVNQQLELIYIAYFNRAADGGGITYWAGQDAQAQAAGQSAALALTNIANSFTPQPETLALYPFLATPNLNLNTPDAQANLNTFINSVYDNLFGRAPDAAGNAFWVGQITNGLIGLGAAALAIANGATGSDAIEVRNKIAVALDFTTRTAAAGLGETVPLPGSFVTAAHTVLNGVDGAWLNDASVAAGMSATTTYISGSATGTTTTGSVDTSIITITGSDQLIDPGTGHHTIQFLAGASDDTLILHINGMDQIVGFDPSTDVLDLRSLLSEASVDLNGNVAALGNYLMITDQGSDALVSFHPTGHGGGSTVAVLQGLGSSVTGLDTLVAHGAVRIA